MACKMPPHTFVFHISQNLGIQESAVNLNELRRHNALSSPSTSPPHHSLVPFLHFSWCNLQVKMCDPCLSALLLKKHYINTLPFLSFPLLLPLPSLLPILLLPPLPHQVSKMWQNTATSSSEVCHLQSRSRP